MASTALNLGPYGLPSQFRVPLGAARNKENLAFEWRTSKVVPNILRSLLVPYVMHSGLGGNGLISGCSFTLVGPYSRIVFHKRTKICYQQKATASFKLSPGSKLQSITICRQRRLI